MGDPSPALFDWRRLLPVHPAALLFPPLLEEEMAELTEGIKANGLQVPVVTWSEKEGDKPQLLDGVHRLDAMAALGLLYETSDHRLGFRAWDEIRKAWAPLVPSCWTCIQDITGGNPHELVLDFNVRRRQMSAEKKNEVVDTLIKANPEKSNRQIAELAKVGHPKVARQRSRLEARGDVERRSTSTDTMGRSQPATKGKGRGKKAVPAQPTAAPALKLISSQTLAAQQEQARRRGEQYAATETEKAETATVGGVPAKEQAVGGAKEQVVGGAEDQEPAVTIAHDPVTRKITVVDTLDSVKPAKPGSVRHYSLTLRKAVCALNNVALAKNIFVETELLADLEDATALLHQVKTVLLKAKLKKKGFIS
jgi:hypothetical protein